jgi:hypothetical protein
VSNPNEVTKGVIGLTMDGVDLAPDSDLALLDDGSTHQVRVIMG